MIRKYIYTKTNRKKTIDPICFKFKIFLSLGPAHPADGAKNRGGVKINFVHSTTKIQTENEKLKFCLKRKKKKFYSTFCMRMFSPAPPTVPEVNYLLPQISQFAVL